MSYDCSWILENNGSVNLYTFDFCILGFSSSVGTHYVRTWVLKP